MTRSVSAIEEALRQITADSSQDAMQNAWFGDYRARMNLLAPFDQTPEAPMAVDVPTLPEEATFWPAVFHSLASVACIILSGVAGGWLALAYLGVW